MTQATPLILAIETSHAQGEVALGTAELPLVRPFSPGLVHGRELQPRIAEVFDECDAQAADLGAIAVSAGPGSYTGVRIGIACAKTMAWALGVPVLGVSTLEAIAANVTEAGAFVVLLDARRGACYSARFLATETEDGRVRVERETPDELGDPAELRASLDPATHVVGEGLRTLEGFESFSAFPEEWNLPRAKHVYHIARRDLVAIKNGRQPAPPEFENPHGLEPRYLRASQAEERQNPARTGGS